MNVVAEVRLWGKAIGAVSWDPRLRVAVFEYTPEFQRSGIEVAPLVMPLDSRLYTFPQLGWDAFRGLPGLLADSLPGKFGNLLIDEWLARSGQDAQSFSPVDRLCYVGTRGMGALEYHPAIAREADRSTPLDVENMVELANSALSQKRTLRTRFTGEEDGDYRAMKEILRVGTSAGGARAKAIIAWNEDSGEIRSGQVEAPEGFGYWLMKFDGVSGNRDKELEDPLGFGKIEFAYSQMAKAAGIEMAECRLYHENDRSHFVTRRFDRTEEGGKLFMQTLCAVAHFDFNQARAYSYEQALQVAQELHLSAPEREQMFRRMAFNLMARNQDDHTKNIAFLMDQEGEWSLSPAYDVTYSYNPQGAWTNQHQMSLNGKTDRIDRGDFAHTAERYRLFRGSRLMDLLTEIDEVLEEWPMYAKQAGVSEEWTTSIGAAHRRLCTLS